jgi:hypothetical protein
MSQRANNSVSRPFSAQPLQPSGFPANCPAHLGFGTSDPVGSFRHQRQQAIAMEVDHVGSQEQIRVAGVAD